MGLAKNQLIREEEQGWSFINEKYVCADCIGDVAIKTIIRNNASSNNCSYCGVTRKSKKIACDMNVVMKAIAEGIFFEYAHAVDGVGWIDGEWQANVIDTWDLVRDELELGIEEDKLYRDIIDSLGMTDWSRRDPYGVTEDEELYIDWEIFIKNIKHRNRYFFYSGRELVNSPLLILEHLDYIVTKLGLTRTISSGFSLYRGRVHNHDEGYSTPEQLGSPREEDAKYANRMSAAGIPMFYGSEDTQTVLAEVNQGDTTALYISIGEFEALRDLRVLDLTSIPAVPSLFDEQNRHLRPVIKFIHAFVHDFTKPVVKDGREHIEYVPTQVVTEYFRHVYQTPEGRNLDGVVYPSAVHQGGRSYVLFFDQKDCCGGTLKLYNSTKIKLK